MGHYSIVRFIPDLIRDEPINVGVLLQTGDNMDLMVPVALTQLEKLTPDMDKEYLSMALENLRDEVGEGLTAPWRSNSDYLSFLHSEFIHEIQISSPRPVVVDDFIGELKELFETFVSQRAVSEHRYVVKRNQVVTMVKEALSEFKVARHFKPYTAELHRSGDKVDLDMAHSNGAVHIIQGFSLDVGLPEEVKEEVDAWAFRFEDIVARLPKGSEISTVVYPSQRDGTELAKRARNVFQDVGCAFYRADRTSDLVQLAGRMRQVVEKSSPPDLELLQK